MENINDGSNKGNSCNELEKDLKILVESLPIFTNELNVKLDTRIKFNDLFNSFLKESHVHDYYWEYCSFKTYQKVFEIRLNQFCDYNLDTTEIDFLNNERSMLISLNNPDCYVEYSEGGKYGPNGKTLGFVYTYNNSIVRLEAMLTENEIKRLETSYKKKKDFIDLKLKSLQENQFEGKKSSFSDLPERDNPDPHLFTDIGFQLFSYLSENFIYEKKRTKFIVIYHFLKEDASQYLKGTQGKYLNFIEKNYSIRISRITPATYRYTDELRVTLRQLVNELRKKSSFE